MNQEPLPNTPTTSSIAPKTDTGRGLLRRAALVGVLLGLFAFVFYAGYQKGRYGEVSETPVSPEDVQFVNTSAPSADTTIDFSLFWRVFDVVKEKYVDSENLDARKMFYGAIDGMLAATGDPYTTFFSPQENKEFKEELSQSFDGIGAEMVIKDNILTVVAPLEDSPAEKAGILPGDRVLKINGESTENLGLSEAVSKIRGPRGSEVTLSVFHPDEDELRDITVKRETIVVKSVIVEMKEDGIALIEVTRFGEDTTREFREAVQVVRRENARGIIVDVRNNPGGFLDAAVDLAGYFVPNGSVVVIEENADKERRERRTSQEAPFLALPIVVLINEGSASASEILAAALRENRDHVTLVGMKSFGKGSVQELVPVSSDTSVKVTVAHWLTPKGNQINTVGITPDVEVKQLREDIEAKRDPQLDRALEIMKEKLQ